MTHYLYLHGFGSGPKSQKAQRMNLRFQNLGLHLEIPDLNQEDFSHLTLSRQIGQVSDQVLAWSDPVVIIGSSLGGLTAAWVAQQPRLQGRIAQLVLLAPAFDFLTQWLPRLGSAQMDRWRTTGYLAVYHYDAQQTLPLHYNFWLDGETYCDRNLQAVVPTLILHGLQDEVISIEASRTYAATRPWVNLVELWDDHSLLGTEELIWQHTWAFLAQSKPNVAELRNF